MHFLIEPPCRAPLLSCSGDSDIKPRMSVTMGAPDDTIAEHVKSNYLVLVPCDFDFADIRNYPPSFYQGIVVVKLHEDATAEQVARLLVSFARRQDWLKHLTGRLDIGETGRLRFGHPESFLPRKQPHG